MIPDRIRRLLGLPLILRHVAPAEPAPVIAMAVYCPRLGAVQLITARGALYAPPEEVPGIIVALQAALATRDLARVMMASRLQ